MAASTRIHMANSTIKLTPSEVLTEAEGLIGYQAWKVDRRRSWAAFWCPFHPDAERKGKTGKPNFGVNLDTGAWNCFVCDAKGPSLTKLAEALGKDYQPAPLPAGSFRLEREMPDSTNPVTELDLAIQEARAAYFNSPAAKYVASRGITDYTAAVYGLGYGKAFPIVNRYTARAAYASQLVLKGGVWQWAESVVYADPLVLPVVINCRYLPNAKDRPFNITANHHSWGKRIVPLGAWRINGQTKVLVVVEGLFDLLAGAQITDKRGLGQEVVVIATNGSKPSWRMLEWFNGHTQYEYVLVKDNDQADKHHNIASEKWEEMLKEAIGKPVVTYLPPEGKDPDEAFLSGWWPSAI